MLVLVHGKLFMASGKPASQLMIFPRSCYTQSSSLMELLERMDEPFMGNPKQGTDGAIVTSHGSGRTILISSWVRFSSQVAPCLYHLPQSLLTRRPDAEAEASILWPPDMKSPLIGEDADAWKIEGRRRRVGQKMRWLENLSKLQEMVKDRGAWCAAVHGVTVRHDLATEQQQKPDLSLLDISVWWFFLPYFLHHGPELRAGHWKVCSTHWF